jgi:hypothetical protein
MRSILLRGISDGLYREIKTRSKKELKSMNRLILSIVESNFGIAGQKIKTKKRYTDIESLFGKWSDDEYKKIRGITEAQRKIDDELWK